MIYSRIDEEFFWSPGPDRADVPTTPLGSEKFEDKYYTRNPKCRAFTG